MVKVIEMIVFENSFSLVEFKEGYFRGGDFEFIDSRFSELLDFVVFVRIKCI